MNREAVGAGPVCSGCTMVHSESPNTGPEVSNQRRITRIALTPQIRSGQFARVGWRISSVILAQPHKMAAEI